MSVRPARTGSPAAVLRPAAPARASSARRPSRLLGGVVGLSALVLLSACATAPSDDVAGRGARAAREEDDGRQADRGPEEARTTTGGRLAERAG